MKVLMGQMSTESYQVLRHSLLFWTPHFKPGPSTHFRYLTTYCNSSSWDLIIFLAIVETSTYMAQHKVYIFGTGLPSSCCCCCVIFYFFGGQKATFIFFSCFFYHLEGKIVFSSWLPLKRVIGSKASLPCFTLRLNLFLYPPYIKECVHIMFNDMMIQMHRLLMIQLSVSLFCCVT